MASRIEVFSVTVPGGTSIATPQTTALTFPLGVVQRLEILIPPGPSGLVGFRIQHSGRTIIPYDTSKWLVADNESIKWDLENYPVGSAWAMQAYNTDVYDHTLYLRFLVVETVRSQASAVPILSIAPIPEAASESETAEVA